MQIELVSEGEEKPEGKFQIEPVEVEPEKPSFWERVLPPKELGEDIAPWVGGKRELAPREEIAPKLLPSQGEVATGPARPREEFPVEATAHDLPWLQPGHQPQVSAPTPPQRELGPLGKALEKITPAIQTVQDIASVYAPLEAAANLFSQTYGLSATGVAQLIGLPFGKSRELGEAVSKATIYEPKTEAGRRLSRTASYPFELLDVAGEKAADITREVTGSPALATGVGTAIKAAPLALGVRRTALSALKSVTDSSWYRSMTIPERSLVVQSLDDMISKGYGEGEILRRWNNPTWREEALARRMKGEELPPEISPEPTPKPTPKPKPLKIEPVEVTKEPAPIEEPLPRGEVPQKAMPVSEEALEKPLTPRTPPSEWQRDPVLVADADKVVKRINKEFPEAEKLVPEDLEYQAVQKFGDLGTGMRMWNVNKPGHPKNESAVYGPTFKLGKETVEKEKEPWEMTKADFLKSTVDQLVKDGMDRKDAEEFGTTDTTTMGVTYGPNSTHRQAVNAAISEGKSVPPEVLVDYPDLQPKETQPLRPAIIHEGEQIEGETGATHDEIRAENDIPKGEGEPGFVRDKEFLTREEAKEDVKAKEPEVHEAIVEKRGEDYKLHSQDYREAAGIEPAKKEPAEQKWDKFEPNQYGYQPRELPGLKKGYFVAQQSYSRFDIIESEIGTIRAIITKSAGGKWQFKPQVPSIGEDKILFKPTGKFYDTPQKAILEFNQYKDMIDKPEAVRLEEYKEFGKPSTHRNAVTNAVNRGESPEGLKDYPDLKKEVPDEIRYQQEGRVRQDKDVGTRGIPAEASDRSRLLDDRGGKEEEKEEGKVTPDLTVTGQSRPVPNRVGVEYNVHRVKPVLDDDRTYKVTMIKRQPGFLSTYGKGTTAEEAYDDALENYDAMEGERTPSEPEFEEAEITPTKAGVVVRPKGGEPHLAGEKQLPKIPARGELTEEEPRPPLEEGHYYKLGHEHGASGTGYATPIGMTLEDVLEKMGLTPEQADEYMEGYRAAEKPTKDKYPVFIDPWGKKEHRAILWAIDIKKTGPGRFGGSGWEWYGFQKTGPDTYYGFVHGLEDEWGDFSLSELKDAGVKIVTDPEELHGIMPPIGWTKKPLTMPTKGSIEKPEAKHGIELAEREGIEGVGKKELEGAPTKVVPKPPTVRPTRGVPEPSGEEHPGRLPEGEKPVDREGAQAEPSPRERVGDGEGRVAPETERGAERPGEPEPRVEPVRQPSEKREPAPQYPNFRVTPDFEKTLQQVSSNVKTRIRNNIDAIKLLKKIEGENRLATAEEQSKLAQFTGWGGAPQVFNRYGDFKPQFEELEKLLTDDEFEAARASTPNAHYTSPDVIRFMWDALDRMGLRKGRILDPSMGTGLFEGLIPDKLLPFAKISGVELDPVSGRIAKQLFQNADVRVMGFEHTKYPNDFFDLAISNIPFGDYKVHDPVYNKFNATIHNYFFLKSLDKVRPGGVVAFITSHYSMDSVNPKMRELISEKADFVGAVRLPKTAFKGIANTEVVTDVIFLRKKIPGQESAGEDWLQTVEKEGFSHNVYYDSHPENILGKESTTGSMYRDQEYTVEGRPGQDIAEDLKKVLPNLPQDIIKPFDRPEPKVELTSSIPAPDYIKEGAFIVSGRGIYQRKGDDLNPADIPQVQVGKTKALIKVRDAARELLHKEMESEYEADIKPLMASLNREYDKFVRQYGPFHDGKNRRDLAFSDDPDYPLILSLEKWDADTKRAKKADIFNKRVMTPFKKIEKVETSKEALVVSLSEAGGVNFGRMEELTGFPISKLQQDLAGLVFQNPEGMKWETADEYLSGNVREKLKIAQGAAEADPAYSANAEALKAVQPEDLTHDQIEARLGSPWLRPNDIQGFMREVLDIGGEMNVGYSPSIAVWTMERGRRGWGTQSVANTETYGTPDISGHELVALALNHQTPTVRRTDSDGKTWVDVPATEAAREKQYQIKEKFKEWVWEEPERRKTLTAKYNEEMNNLRVREFDGKHLTLPGIVSEDIIELRPHQKDGVWRIIQSPSTLLGHVVGAGKTYTMVAGAMELRRTGIAKKPMFVVPNHLTEQWGEDFLRLYPNANILTATKKDFTPLGRNVFLSKIATGDWDAVIVPHTSFGRIPMSKKAVVDFLNQQKADLESSIRELQAEGEKKGSRIIKQIEKAKKRLEQKILDKLAEEEKTGNLTFEEMGVDQLFVDEAHYFKNLLFSTKMQRVAGVGGTASERASDLFIKCNHLMNKYGRGIVFATGTPVSNTMAEMYTMQRYLQPKALAEKGLQMFDAWAGNFGDTVSTLELAPEGSGYRVKSRFAKFVNVPELLQMYRTMADIKTQDMLKLPVPDIEGGKPKVIASPASQYLKDFVETLVQRAESVRRGNVDPRVDNMLKITNDGRKAALDMRLISDMAGAGYDVSKGSEESKINKAARNIADIYTKTKNDNLTQVVFSDLGTPKSDDRFDVYRDLRDKLVVAGIPRSEIAFIHDYEKEVDKQKLFDKVNSGKIRVLMGSTDKMGVGTNVQKKLIALHHIDAPWRPADIEQREGRIIRQGNDNKEVQLYRYVTEGSFDAYMWQILENKARFITQVMTNRLDARSAEDVEGAALTYAEVKAIASGNPLVIEKVKVDTELRRLQMLRSQFTKSRAKMQDRLAMQDTIIDNQEKRIKAADADISKRKIPEEFEIEVQGKKYTDRKEAGKAIIAAAQKLFQDVTNGRTLNTPKVIGTYGGFEFSIKPADPSHTIIGGQTTGFGSSVSESETGTIQSIEHAVKTYPETTKKQSEQWLKEAKDTMKGLEDELEKPFPQKKEMDELTKKQETINKSLNLDRDQGNTETLEGAAGEDPAEVMDQEAPGNGDPEEAVLSSEWGEKTPSAVKEPEVEWWRSKKPEEKGIVSEGGGKEKETVLIPITRKEADALQGLFVVGPAETTGEVAVFQRGGPDVTGLENWYLKDYPIVKGATYPGRGKSYVPTKEQSDLFNAIRKDRANRFRQAEEGLVSPKELQPGLSAKEILKGETGAVALDLLTPGLDIARDFKQGIASLLLPTSKSPQHLQAAEVLGHRLGSMNRDAESAAREIQKDSRMFDKLGVHKADIPLDQNPGVKFMSDMSQGRTMKPDLQKIADKVTQLFDERLDKLELAGAPVETTRETYFPGMWTVQSRRAFNQAIGEAFDQEIGGGIEDLNEWSREDKAWVKDRTRDLMKDSKGSDHDGLSYLSKRPFKGKQSFRKPKVFDDIMTGVEFGLVPISPNPIDLVGLKLAEMDRSIMANRALREWEAKGDVINVNNSGEPLKKALRPNFIKEDWDRIDDPYGTIWHRNPDTHLLEKVGYRIARKPVADILNNYLSSTLYNSPYFGRAFKAYMASANLLNQSQLSWFSAFHGGFTEAEVTISAVANVIKDVYGVMIPRNRSISDLTKTIGKVPVAFAHTPYTGAKIVKEWETPTINVPIDVPVSQLPQNTQGKIATITKAAEIAGGGFTMERGLKTEQTEKMIRDWYGGERAKAVARSPVALLEASAWPILRWLVPKQKAGVFGELVGRLVETNPDKTLEQLRPELRQAWNRVDARLGQVRYNRLFVNNVAKNVVQSLIRAPGWTGGTIAEIGGAPKDAGKFFYEWIKNGKAPKDIPDRVAYVASLLMMSALVNGVLTYVFTGEMPQGVDYLAFRDGGKDERGRATRWVLPTYAKDVYAWYRDPLKTLFAKGHPLISLAYDILMNRDYYGVKIYNEDDDFMVRQIDKGRFVLKQFVPFWIRGAQKATERGGGLAKTLKEAPLKLVAPEVGIMPAARAYTQSSFEEYAYKMRGQKTSVGGRTKEQAERGQFKSKLEMGIRRGDEEAKSNIREAKKEGKITSREKTEIEKRAKENSTQRAAEGLGVDELAKGWLKATEEERRILRPIFKKKIDRAYNDKRISKETKNRYKSLARGE